MIFRLWPNGSWRSSFIGDFYEPRCKQFDRHAFRYFGDSDSSDDGPAIYCNYAVELHLVAKIF